MTIRTLQFLAILLAAVVLIPAGAHLFALPNKIGLGRDQYFTVQSIYWGWAWFGVTIVAELIVVAILAFMLRDQTVPFALTLVALVGIIATLLIFLVWTEPANRATQNWTSIPSDWERLRAVWEYSHAASALVAFINLAALTLAAMTTRLPAP